MSSRSSRRSWLSGIQAVPGELSLHEVLSRSDLREFIGFPYHLYRGCPYWVPPLRLDVKQILSPKNPFYVHARHCLFLARHSGEVVGRVGAFIDDLHLKHHGDATGFFGFFECVDDEAVASALLNRAAAWVRAGGMERIRGPVNPSMNEECGLLVEGFEARPTLMMPYTHRYYPALLEAAGFAKAKDLLSLAGPLPEQMPQRLVRTEAMIRKREPGLSERPLDLRRFDAEVATVQTIYNQAWEANWGFVPMTDGEILAMAKRLKPLVVPDLVRIAEAGDQPVAVALALPDYNQALCHMGGRLTPWTALKFLYHRRRISAFRVLAMGIIPAWRRRGADALLFIGLWKAARRLGYTTGEMSWLLEDNDLVIRISEAFGGMRTKVHRLYERPC